MSLTLLAWISITIAVICALIIVFDELRHPQPMAIMNVVWPVTALYLSVFALGAYLRLGRKQTHHASQHMKGAEDKSRKKTITVSQVAFGTSHCGAGCMIADLLTEFALAFSGLVIVGSVLCTEYLFDLIAAWLLGIVFQYFAIRPMRQDLSRGGAVLAAIKADTLSILAFQLGMYAWMALVYFRLFPSPHLTAFDPRFWLMMQLGMICGFITSYPMNRLLITRGLKEAM